MHTAAPSGLHSLRLYFRFNSAKVNAELEADEHATSRSDSTGNQSQRSEAGGKRERKVAGKLSQTGASRQSARGRFTGPFPGRIGIRPARTGLSRKSTRRFGQ